MKRKSVYSIILSALMCMSLLPVFPLKVKTVSATTEDLVLSMKFDGDLTDSSGNSYDGECTYGNITYGEGIYGKCAVFNGKSYIEVQDNNDLDLKDNFTISLWAYKENMKQDNVPYVYKAEDENCWATPYNLYEHFRNTPAIYMHDGDAGTELNQFRVDGTPVDIRQWFLLTVTYNGSEVRMYQNGQLMKKVNVSGATAATVGNLYIGMMVGLDGSIYYKGKMDDLRIYSRALSANEVGTLYNDGVAANSRLLKQPNALVAYYKFEDNFKDSSSFGNDAAKATGQGTVKFVDAVCSKGAKFTKGSYLEVKDNDSINFDEGFSFTGWICINKRDAAMPLIHRIGVSCGDTSNDSAYDVTAYDTGCEFKYTPFLDGFSPDGSWYTFTNSLYHKWYHIGVTFNGKQIRWYKNGNLVQKASLDGIKIAHAEGSLMIGSDGENFLEGTLDELKLYNYELSADEVKKDSGRMDSLSVSKTNMNSLKSLKRNKTVTLQISRKYIDTGKSEVVSSGVTYASSNKSVFTVTADGKVKAVGKGTAKLTISHGGISKTYKVNVR